MDLTALITAAGGAQPVDLLFENARLVNVFSGEIETRHIAVSGGYVAGFGTYRARERIDLDGRYVVPGFIDAHVHIESAMTAVPEFVRAVLPRGTTTGPGGACPAHCRAHVDATLGCCLPADAWFD